MQPWTVEYGTFWAIQPDKRLPPVYSAEIETTFEEAGSADVENLASAMNLPRPTLIEERFRQQRRCFCLKRDGRIVTYGWVTHGKEHVGEMERYFNLHDSEAYIWHCGTISECRRKGLYSALLSQIIHRLAEEKSRGTIPTIWIGASRLNQPSIQGIANAGFKRVADVTYRRIMNLTLMWFKESTSDYPALIPEVYRIMLKNRDRRIGNLAIGWYTGK